MGEQLARLIKRFAENVVRKDWQGTPYHIAPHMEEWLQLWAEHPLLLVLAARGHGKTETLVVLPILHLATMKHDLLIYLVSVTQEQANKILERIKRILERDYPEVIDRTKWATQEIRTTTRVTIVAKGVLTSIIGPHPQYIFVDDPIEDRQSHTDTAIESWFLADLFPMLAKNGRLMVVGTYKHFGDLFHALQEKGIFEVRVYPAHDERGELLWSEYWTKTMLEERRAVLGSVLFAREYLLHPVDDSSSLFPMHLLTECYAPELSLTKQYQGSGEVYVGVDPAASGAIGADYSAFCIIEYDKATNRRTLLDLVRQRGLSLQAHIDLLRYIEQAYRPAHVKIEKNAFQRWLEQEASGALKGMPLSGHITGKEKSDLRDGVPSLRLLLERKELRIPRGLSEGETKAGLAPYEAEAVKATDPLVHELNSMTWDAGKVVSVAKHDDTVMALWLCNMAIEEGKKERGIAMALVDTGIIPRRPGKRLSSITRGRLQH